METFQLTLPAIVGYAAVGYLLLKALAHRSAARELRKVTRKAAEHLDRTLPRPPHAGRVRRSAVDKSWARLQTTAGEHARSHPTAAVLVDFTQSPELADDEMALDAWMAGALEGHVGPLRRACELNAGTAAPVGLLGTIAGFVIGTYTFAQIQSTSALMGSIALALLTTFVASFVVLLERRLVKGVLEPLESACAQHMQVWVARGRALHRWRKAGTRQGPGALAARSLRARSAERCAS